MNIKILFKTAFLIFLLNVPITFGVKHFIEYPKALSKLSQVDGMLANLKLLPANNRKDYLSGVISDTSQYTGTSKAEKVAIIEKIEARLVRTHKWVIDLTVPAINKLLIEISRNEKSELSETDLLLLRAEALIEASNIKDYQKPYDLEAVLTAAELLENSDSVILRNKFTDLSFQMKKRGLNNYLQRTVE